LTVTGDGKIVIERHDGDGQWSRIWHSDQPLVFGR
jgi:hypothetical protein